MIAINKYNNQHPLRVFEAFAGYGSQSLAFKYLKDKHPEFDFKVISKSKLYALAGNSIVTNCLTAMFEELIFPSGNHYHDKTGQLSLF